MILFHQYHPPQHLRNDEAMIHGKIHHIFRACLFNIKNISCSDYVTFISTIMPLKFSIITKDENVKLMPLNFTQIGILKIFTKK